MGVCCQLVGLRSARSPTTGILGRLGVVDEALLCSLVWLQADIHSLLQGKGGLRDTRCEMGQLKRGDRDSRASFRLRRPCRFLRNSCKRMDSWTSTCEDDNHRF